jgi:Tfp pilus assembly protein PilF
MLTAKCEPSTTVNADARAEALFFEGNRHLTAGDAVAAESCFREALELEADFAEAHANLALLLDQDGRVEEAEQHYRQAIRLDPECGQSHLNLGALLAGQKRFDEAELAYLHAVALIPESPAAWSNFGALQACRKREEAAELSYRKALALDPEYRSAHFNLAYLLLRQGRFDEGWASFEKRAWYRQLEPRLPCPRWQGEAIDSRSILIGFEAGHGDMIQFCRYASVLKADGAARVDILCHPGLKALLATLDGVDHVLAFDEALPPLRWDWWTPSLSLPFHCRTRLESIPARLPYLHADPVGRERWAAELDRLSVPGQLRVGLVWKGNPRFENDADRSLPSLAALEPLGAISGIRWFSLQKGAGEGEATHPPAGLSIVDLAPQLHDFADTAALIANLDLVVGVDTAVMHLAGALARPCWLLLPDYMADWRWLTERRDSPWYPGVMRLFRQARMGDWAGAIDEVAEALKDLHATGLAGLQYT